ncbi:MAG: hypothetical protein QG654_45 [Patescibacteria group bacterium]|nr:hypothetical protein [Patescibacteria group bacterium]
MSKGLKILLMFLILAVFGAIAYFLLGNEDFSLNVSPTASPLETTNSQPVSGLAAQTTPDIDADQIGQEFLTQLLNIRSIKLREDIFSRPAFISLTDFTIELIQLGNEGRENPFAPFGVDSSTQMIDPLTGLPMATDPSALPEGTTPVSGPGNVVPISPMQTSSPSTSPLSTPPPNLSNN